MEFPIGVTSKITISVTAYGAGKSITQDKTVDILPVIVPTMKDSLAAHGWKLKNRETWQISTNTAIYRDELSADQLSDVKFYTLDNYWHLYHAGQTTEFAGGKYTLVGKILTAGDQVYTITLLTNSKLQYEQVYKYADDQKIVSFYEAVP